MEQIITVGRRKTSTARVFLQKGKGEITVNKKKLEDYFGREVAQLVVIQPLESTDLSKGVDIKATVFLYVFVCLIVCQIVVVWEKKI